MLANLVLQKNINRNKNKYSENQVYLHMYKISNRVTRLPNPAGRAGVMFLFGMMVC